MPNGRCIVVGRGAIGWAVAFRLATEGWQTTIVGPSESTGGSASGAAGAMLGVLGEVTSLADDPSSEVRLDLRLRAGRMYEQWLNEVAAHGAAVPPLGRGTFVVASADRKQDALAVHAMQQLGDERGLRVERVSANAIPGFSPSPAHPQGGALFLADECWIDASALLPALREASLNMGVIAVDDEVAGLRSDKRVVRVGVASGALEADEVVLCAGTAVGKLTASLGIENLMPEVVCAKGAGLLLRSPSAAGDPVEHVLRTPNRDFACGLHLVPRMDGACYLGATNRASRIPGITGGATAGEVAHLVEGAAEELVSKIRRWDCMSHFHGERPLAVDRLPIAGRTSVDGISVATGTYRDGILLAPLIADVVARGLRGVADATCEAISPIPGVRLSQAMPGPAQLLAAGQEQLLEIACQGERGWQETFAGALDAVARMALEGDDETAGLRRRAEQFLSRYPLTEMVPELLFELAQERDVLTR